MYLHEMVVVWYWSCWRILEDQPDQLTIPTHSAQASHPLRPQITIEEPCPEKQIFCADFSGGFFCR